MIPSACRHFFPSLIRGRGLFLVQASRVTVSQGRTVTGAAAATEEDKKLKTFEDLPGPTLLTNLYWVLLRGYLLYSHELQLIFKKKYGPIWKATLGPYKSVNIADAYILEKVLRNEGKYPMRSDMKVWKEHRIRRDLAFGPFTEEGHRWHTLRSVLNQRMLKPKEAMLYTGVVNEVVTDFLGMLDDMRKESPSGVMVTDIPNALYRFALEGISYILFETRIGCLEKQIPMETQRFIDSIGMMMKYSLYATVFPPWTQNVLPFWKRYMESWDNIFAFGNKLIDQKMETIQARLERGEEVQGEYLTYLLSSGKLTNKEIYGSVAELLLAGVDTTSNTLSWAMYHLARDPKTQNALYKEVTSVVSTEGIPSAEDISRMPLLRAVIKEVLRMYPVVPTNARVAVEKEITIGDYHFPKDTLFALGSYAMGRDETSFPEPNKFMPQRWFRDGAIKHHPFSSIPFGYGVRACVGRRIAELEMHMALSRIIQKYEIRPDPQGTNIRSIARTVLAPEKPIDLEFVKRSQQLA
ncbi:sterol 26-hydroxylase, mitochondrial-like [Discoglossus pictus]